jgi:hypothetical protein
MLMLMNFECCVEATLFYKEMKIKDGKCNERKNATVRKESWLLEKEITRGRVSSETTITVIECK